MVAEQGPRIDRFVSRRAARLPRICSKITAERAEAVRLSGQDVLSLKPYPVVPLPEHVLEAADRAACENQAVPGTGALGLREAIAAKLERETGWRLAEEFGKLLDWEVLMCSHVGQAAAEAAIAGPPDWLREIPLRFAQQRDLIWSALQDVRGLAVRKPEGSPFLFPNVSRLGVSGDEFWRILLDDYGVPTEPGSFFKSSDHVRLSFGAPLDVLAEAGRRVSLAAAQALDRVGGSN